jgi:hypothetical protein
MCWFQIGVACFSVHRVGGAVYPSGVGAPPVGLCAVTLLDAAVVIFRLLQIALGTDACLRTRAHTHKYLVSCTKFLYDAFLKKKL